MEAVLKKRFGKLGREEKGFTLIELLAVIVIIGIIAVIAIPLIGNILSKSKDSADLATARQVYDAARLYITSEGNGDFKATENRTISIEKLQDSGYLDKSLYLPSTKAPISKTGVVTFSDLGQLVSVTLNSKVYNAENVLSSSSKADKAE
ncbi:prepilin-type N-terminal cleavage/methylation domain-containing protein [Paenibacillus chibensis]|uniref:prepilin-type N-terminal cleavage/methylation domain-containing protein n=1 Tax=Paenibacillus chibensis TaxID=59846 RepID=UPI000FD84CDC|nr:prepilin-type N-terminal cleavage/methylation domain-containing protein [Paenibacillus chibensis]MEC0370764.1 prepilin-type N-terminal cleavage/methylation domain-containing protein [Paenibacillus chibensis]